MGRILQINESLAAAQGTYVCEEERWREICRDSALQLSPMIL